MIPRWIRRSLEMMRRIGSTLGWHGLISGLIALAAFGYGLGMLAQEYQPPRYTEREVLRRVLANWSEAPDYLGKTLHDYAREWWESVVASERAPRLLRLNESLRDLGEKLEEHDAQFPLITVVGLQLFEESKRPLDDWRPEFAPGPSATIVTEAIPIVEEGGRPVISLEVRYQLAEEVVSVIHAASVYYHRMIRALIGLSGASLLCFGYMVLHVLGLRDKVAREAARDATLDLADRTCHELGNVAFVVANERRNLASHIDLLHRFIEEEPDARAAAMGRAGIDQVSATRFEHAIRREYAEREIDPEIELRRSAAMATDVCRQIAICSDYMTLTVRELDGFLKQSELPVDIGSINAVEIFQEAEALLTPRLEAADVAVRRPLSTEVPVFIRGDRRLLLHAIVNLFKNAIEAVTGSSGPPTIELSTAIEGGFVWLGIADNGPGVSAADSRVLFEDGYSTKGPGRGRGLAIVRESVRLQGGRIRMSPRTGGGTIFSVGLPTDR